MKTGSAAVSNADIQPLLQVSHTDRVKVVSTVALRWMVMGSTGS
jgi:hypothetical protein